MNAKEIFFKLKGSKQICEYNSDSNPIVANNYTYYRYCVDFNHNSSAFMGSYHKRIKNGLIAIVGLFVAFKIAFAMVLITDRNISNAEYILLGGLSLIMDVILVYRFIKRYRSPYKWVLDKVNAATFIRPTSYATSSAASYYTITYFNIFGKPLSVSKAVTIDSLMMDFQHYLYREMKKYNQYDQKL